MRFDVPVQDITAVHATGPIYAARLHATKSKEKKDNAVNMRLFEM